MDKEEKISLDLDKNSDDGNNEHEELLEIYHKIDDDFKIKILITFLKKIMRYEMDITMSSDQINQVEKYIRKLRENIQCLDDWIEFIYVHKSIVKKQSRILTLLEAIRNDYASCLIELNEMIELAKYKSTMNEVKTENERYKNEIASKGRE